MAQGDAKKPQPAKVGQADKAEAPKAAPAKVEAVKDEANAKPEAAKSEEKKAAAPAKPVKAAVKKINRKAAKKVATAKKPAARKAAPKPAPEPAARKEKTMTNFDMSKWFGGYDVPSAEKVEELMAKAGQQGEEWVAKTRAGSEELAELAKANVEAMIESSKIAASGAKDIGTGLIEDGRTQFEAASDNLRRLAEAKNPQEYMAIQSELAKSQFDLMVAEGSKLTEKMVKLAGDAMQPVSNRASLNVEKVKSLMA